MARKADIKNLIKEAERKDQRVAEIEKMLEAAKNDSVGAWDKVSIRRNELEQEINKGLASIVREVFWEDITPDEFEKEMKELLLINEVKEYIESEREKRKAAADNNSDETDNDEPDNNTDADTPIDNMAAE